VRPSAGAAAVPSPALAVCSAYNGAACCDVDAELSFTLAVAQSGYAGYAACYSALLDVHCGTECHAQQDVFTVGSEVKLCESYCTTLHGLCAGVDDAAAVAPADWCASLTIFPWVAANGGSFTTAVVPDADNVGTCWGGASADDCAGVPNGGQVRDSCGVCGGDGSTCTVPGAATVADLNTQLTTSLSAHITAEQAKQTELGNWATTQAARLATEQARAAAEHAAKLDTTSAARATLVTDMASKDDTITTHMAEVTASLSAARSASTTSMAGLATKVGDSTAAINTDYARVATAHAAQAAVSEAVLAREMASWQATHDSVTAEIDRLKAAN
jgi:hypothetical protein